MTGNVGDLMLALPRRRTVPDALMRPFP